MFGWKLESLLQGTFQRQNHLYNSKNLKQISYILKTDLVVFMRRGAEKGHISDINIMTCDLNGFVEHLLYNRGWLLISQTSSLSALWLCLAGLLLADVQMHNGDIKQLSLRCINILSNLVKVASMQKLPSSLIQYVDIRAPTFL